jgi:predicted nucleotidyltransferase
MENDDIRRELKRAYKNVYAACLYGSRVCGYATKDSDYDVLVILEEYKPGVKYTYVNGAFEIAFLAVSKKVFEEDVYNSSYGGFIADRILNPIKPLVNEEYLVSCELERKKKIITWETSKLVLKNKLNAQLIDINLLYFPFKQWDKIATVYRPFLYSVENMLRSDLREKNLKSLVPGYRRGIEELGFYREVYPGWYRIEQEFVDKILGAGLSAQIERLKMIEREVENIVVRYLTHAKAGDSDRDLVIKEVLSKVQREVRHFKEKGFSIPLEKPEKFLIYPKS